MNGVARLRSITLLLSVYPVEGFIEPAEDIKVQPGDAWWKSRISWIRSRRDALNNRLGAVFGE
jgi:hypothetical protein